MANSIWQTVGSAWSILSQRDDKPTQVALAICVIVVGGVVGCAGAFLYGLSSRTGGVSDRLMGGFVAILACAGAFSVGGMLGLLFGSPTMGSGQTRGQSGGERSTQIGVRPNTSLERVADWLTTMIVGLGLVNLGAIKLEATTMSVWLTQAITGSVSPNGTPGITLAIGFSFAGFLLVYLWSMRFLPSELRDSYDALRERAENAEAQARSLLSKFKENARFVVPEEKLEQIGSRLKGAGVSTDLAMDVVSRYRHAKRADDEPMEQFGPSESRGFKLSAEVNDVGAGKFDVRMTLRAPNGVAVNEVFWLLHNSYAPDVVSDCPVRNGTAIYSTKIDEPFWVGAIVPVGDGEPVRLGLSLADAENAPQSFKNRK